MVGRLPTRVKGDPQCFKGTAVSCQIPGGWNSPTFFWKRVFETFFVWFFNKQKRKVNRKHWRAIPGIEKRFSKPLFVFSFPSLATVLIVNVKEKPSVHSAKSMPVWERNLRLIRVKNQILLNEASVITSDWRWFFRIEKRFGNICFWVGILVFSPHSLQRWPVATCGGTQGSPPSGAKDPRNEGIRMWSNPGSFFRLSFQKSNELHYFPVPKIRKNVESNIFQISRVGRPT